MCDPPIQCDVYLAPKAPKPLDKLVDDGDCGLTWWSHAKVWAKATGNPYEDASTVLHEALHIALEDMDTIYELDVGRKSQEAMVEELEEKLMPFLTVGWVIDILKEATKKGG